MNFTPFCFFIPFALLKIQAYPALFITCDTGRIFVPVINERKILFQAGAAACLDERNELDANSFAVGRINLMNVLPESV